MSTGMIDGDSRKEVDGLKYARGGASCSRSAAGIGFTGEARRILT